MLVRQLTCTAPGRLQWQDIEAPRMNDREAALIRPVAVARCELDPLLVSLGPGSTPFAIGHEAVAEIVDIGADVMTYVPGDLVIPSFQLCCGRCETCRRGWTASCERYPVLSDYGMGSMSGTEYGGMLSDLVVVPHAATMLQLLPAGLDPVTVASAADNMADGYRAVAPHLARRPGSDVLIVCHGGHSIALYAVQAATALGAGEIVFESNDEDTLEIAKRLGATAVPLTFGRRKGRWPIVVDCGADPRGIAHAIASTAANGMVQSVSYYPGDVAIPLGAMYTLGGELHTGRVHSAAELPGVLNLLATGLIDPTLVPVATVAWDDAAERFLEPATKLVVSRPTGGRR